MPDPTPTPATPDQLAAIYLRARDVPCPACGYNRRGGASAACPECGQDLLVRDGTPLESHAQIRSLRRIAGIVLIGAGFEVAGDLFSLGRAILMMVRSGIPLSPMLHSFVWLGLNLIFAAIAMVLARKATTTLRPIPADTGRALRLLMLAVLAALMTGFLSLPIAVLFAIFS